MAVRAEEHAGEASIARRTAIVTATVLAICSAALLLLHLIEIVLLVFAGTLGAVLLSGLARPLSRRMGIGYGWALGIVAGLLVAGLIVTMFLLAPRIGEQAQQIWRRLPEAIQQVQNRLGASEWTRKITEDSPSPSRIARQPEFLSRVAGIFSTTLGAVGAGFILIFVALYLAADPERYRAGVLRLVPIAGRARAAEILDQVGDTLWWWLVAKAASMTVVGALTWIGLAILDVPLAFTLALLAMLLTFIPNVGPIISAAPAILLALMESMSLGLWVAGLYVVVQTLESYLITPLFQQRALSLPPALVITGQVILGTAAGAVGLLVATPFVATAFVLVNELYIHDRLGDNGVPLPPAGV